MQHRHQSFISITSSFMRRNYCIALSCIEKEGGGGVLVWLECYESICNIKGISIRSNRKHASGVGVNHAEESVLINPSNPTKSESSWRDFNRHERQIRLHVILFWRQRILGGVVDPVVFVELKKVLQPLKNQLTKLKVRKWLERGI